MKIIKEIELVIPRVPNFIMVHGEELEKISIGKLSDAQLNEIGLEWIKALKKRADDIRQSPEDPVQRILQSGPRFLGEASNG